mmetsp:Transcript_10261/g.30405  ORF Transcript_10261/g.30405 Transcript_10261/m.30405 type:complete len:590 (+) Transcript_10261:57-1826(+)
MLRSAVAFLALAIAPAAAFSASRPLTRTSVRPARAARAAPAATATTSDVVEEERDVVVIGSGFAGLSCASLLSAAGMDVLVCESHYELGGCAHEFCYRQDGTPVPSDKVDEGERVFRFESGPSLYSGLSWTDGSPNPLKHVYQMIGEEPEWITFDTWGAFLPEAPEGYSLSIGAQAFEQVLQTYGGPTALSDWKRLAARLRPLTDGVKALPASAVRPDAGALLTVVLKYPGAVLRTLQDASRGLTRPFSEVLEEVGVTDPFLTNYLNMLAFLLQGLPMEGTLTAVMAYMVDDFFQPKAVMDFPKGGSGEMIGALARGVTKHGGEVRRRTHVEEVLVENGRAAGVRLRSGRVVKARKAVVSNADLWNTFRFVKPGQHAGLDKERNELVPSTEQCKSFMHLHVGFDAAELPDDIPPQWTTVASWDEPIDSPANVIVVSCGSMLDSDLAPEGKHVIHAYTAGNEPYSIWEGMDRSSPEYAKLKEERSECLWRAIERYIPDIRSRAQVTLVGTPLTCERFLRRDRGTYGPAIAAGEGTFPGVTTPLPGLYRCGDSTTAGIGVPATAAGGAQCANAIMSVWDQLKLNERIVMPV